MRDGFQGLAEHQAGQGVAAWHDPIMAITTGVSSQAHAQARLQLWLDAEEAVSKGQAYSIGDRSLTRANLADIRASIQFWQGQVQAFRAAGLGAGTPGIRVAKWVG